MADIQRFDFDTRIHHAVVHNGTVYLTGQVGTPGTSAEAQMEEVLDKIDRLLAKAGSKRENILQIGEPDGRFDAVVAANVIHLLDEPLRALARRVASDRHGGGVADG